MTALTVQLLDLLAWPRSFPRGFGWATDSRRYQQAGPGCEIVRRRLRS